MSSLPFFEQKRNKLIEANRHVYIKCTYRMTFHCSSREGYYYQLQTLIDSFSYTPRLTRTCTVSDTPVHFGHGVLCTALLLAIMHNSIASNYKLHIHTTWAAGLRRAEPSTVSLSSLITFGVLSFSVTYIYKR